MIFIKKNLFQQFRQNTNRIKHALFFSSGNGDLLLHVRNTASKCTTII